MNFIFKDPVGILSRVAKTWLRGIDLSFADEIGNLLGVLLEIGIMPWKETFLIVDPVTPLDLIEMVYGFMV